MAGVLRHTILVVDDELALRSIICAELDAEGYCATTAGDGDEAIGILLTKHFDLVLLDNQMQRINGSEVLKVVRTHHPATKVIMVTGSKDTPIPTDALGGKPDEIIMKPFDLGELLIAVKNMLETPDRVT
jgi:DNA-binding response OmpR family regulator